MWKDCFCKCIRALLADDEWLVAEEGYHPQKQLVYESIFCLASGYMGNRASAEEGFCRRTLPANYVHGVFDRSEAFQRELVNTPDWCKLKMYYECDPIAPEEGNPPEEYLRVLENCKRPFSREEKLALAEEKNSLYCSMLSGLGSADVLPGVRETLAILHKKQIVIAVGSSSKNTPEILRRTGLESEMRVVVSGLDITHSKPHPEVFIKARQLAGFAPGECLVVEDAETGVQAAKAAGMRVLAVCAAKDNQQADFRFETLEQALAQWPKIFKAFDGA